MEKLEIIDNYKLFHLGVSFYRFQNKESRLKFLYEWIEELEVELPLQIMDFHFQG